MRVSTTAVLISALTLFASGCADDTKTGTAPVSTSTKTAEAPTPTAKPKAASECGKASYYADSLAGNKTASGEPYAPAKITAAHKKLPFGTKVRVVRKDTGKAVVVRINDRGPYSKGRIIDLSRAAAEKVDLIKAGVAEVCITVL